MSIERKFRGKTVHKTIAMVGVVVTINAQSIRVYARDENGNVKDCSGTVVITDGGAGYAKGCTYVKSDVVTGTSGSYKNVGTTASCAFTINT